MSRNRMAALFALLSLTAALGFPRPGAAQQPAASAAPAGVSVAQPADAILLTIFLRHDQSKTVLEINDQLKRQNYINRFPPKGIEIVSWYVMMGIGQVVTLRVPPARLREVNQLRKSHKSISLLGPARASARGQPGNRADRLGRLPHRVLPDL